MASDIRRASVLFVDDEPRILTALRMIFRNDYEVLTADGGAAAIEVLKSRAVDVVVSDQRMPGVTGVEVLSAARELHPRAVRMLLTGYSDLQAVIASVNEGEIFRFVSKPWLNGELRATLAAAVDASGAEPTVVPAATITNAEPSIAAHPASAVGMLVLDDNAEIHTAMRQLMGGSRNVHCATSLDSGMRLLEQHRIGIIVTETSVGGQPVAAVLGALRKQQAALVVLVLTAQPDATRLVELINTGQIYRLLRKPINESVLRGTINLALRRLENMGQPAPAAEPPPRRVEMPAPPPAASEKTGFFGRLKRLFGSPG